MPPPASRPATQAQLLARLVARLEVLEDRVRRLERQLRGGATRAPAGPRARASAPAPPGGPRCPGCTLELPPGRRKAQCVWCGFHFAAAKAARVRGPGAPRR